MRNVFIALAIIATVAATAGARTRQTYYQSVDGTMVHIPTKDGGNYGRVAAICGDGSRSFSHHRQGTCSHHGGVASWQNPPRD